MNITVVGTGYVGLSLATLLSQNHEVVALDVIQEKVEKINNRISPIQDEDIEKFFNIRRSSATGLITSLEEKEYITRESVASDARLKKLILTDKAKNAVSLVDEQVIDLEEKMMQGISEEEIEFFRKIIAKMTKNLLEESRNG